jgi:serine/threonine protein kinase/tetratricopeptide (TPR) repeat protein
MIGQTISHYRILERLGGGGMGVVYKAQDLKLNRVVALKFLPPEFSRDPEAKQRFIHEAQAASALDHNNICTIHEIGETDDGQMFIAMACYEGETLKKKIEHGLLKIEEALDIAIQIAQGLEEAHKHQIVHRDIKPANVLITASGVVKIVDFGLVEIAGRSRVTKEGMTVGTTAYMSPEQAQGEKVDQRTDIWSLGVVMYEMVTGRLPFPGKYEQAIVYRILHEEPEAITSLRSNVPMELERIVKKAVAKNPEDRFQNTGDILVDLKSLRRGLESGVSGELLFTQKSIASIAVLPFEDMSSEKDQEYFCDGIAEELINALSHIKDLHVVARTTAFSFKGTKQDLREVGRRLNVNTVLEGSIRKAGNRLRITAQLIDVVNGYHLWSEKFDKEMGDIFAIQDEISMGIVENLKLKLLPAEKATIEKRYGRDPEAYNLYLRGLYFFNKASPEGFEKGLQYFREAIDRDTSFALPYTGVALVFLTYGMLSLLPPTEILAKSKAASSKALELDDSLAEAHFVAAGIAHTIEWDWKAAENHFEKALALNPRMAICRTYYAWFQIAMGRFDEAIMQVKKTQEIDPLTPLYYAMGAGIHVTAGKIDEGIDQFHKAIELEPNFALAYMHGARLYLAKGMIEEARSALEKSLRLVPCWDAAETCLGAIYDLQGEREKAETILEDLIERKKTICVSASMIAILACELDQWEKAFDFLEMAFEERDGFMSYLQVFAEFAKLRSDARIKPLLRRMNFPEN